MIISHIIYIFDTDINSDIKYINEAHYMIFLIIIFLTPIISFSLYTEIDQNNPDTFSFAIINRVSTQHLIGEDKHDKIIPINTSILEIYYGTPNAFFYSGFRVSQPLIHSSQKDQHNNYSLQKMNDLTLGLSIGGGYGIIIKKATVTHHLKFIANISMDVGVLNRHYSTSDLFQERSTTGTELLFRYHYNFSKKSSLILGLDTGIGMHTEYNEEEDTDVLSGLSIFYGVSIGIGF